MKKTTAAAIITMVAFAAQADDQHKHKESHNQIIERQQTGSVSSGDVPITRRIRGSREIDVYRDGSMFEKENLVGVKR